MNIGQVIAEKLDFLKKQGVSSSKFELRILLGSVLHKEPTELCCCNTYLTEEQTAQFAKLVDMRAKHCPVDKIIGCKGFYKYDFQVNRDVLSPRADTEILVEETIRLITEKNYRNILELGVGSGCVITSVLADTKNTFGLGIDISDTAIKTTAQNAETLQVINRLKLLHASWFDADLNLKIGTDFDVIVSNPPYIPSGEIEDLDAEVKDFDPILALDGGADGLRDYRQICALATKILQPAGRLLFEIGEKQADDVINIAAKHHLTCEKITKDLNGIERCIIFKKIDCI